MSVLPLNAFLSVNKMCREETWFSIKLRHKDMVWWIILVLAGWLDQMIFSNLSDSMILYAIMIFIILLYVDTFKGVEKSVFVTLLIQVLKKRKKNQLCSLIDTHFD